MGSFEVVKKILQQGHVVPNEISYSIRKIENALRATPVELTTAEAHELWKLTSPYIISFKHIRDLIKRKFSEEVFE